MNDAGIGALALAFCLLAAAMAQGAGEKARGGKPKPTFENISYGPHERNVLDFWQAASDKPAPLVIFIHGGGFHAGDKAAVPASLIGKCLENGVSVASINYRLSHQAPYPAPMLDGARAVQFLRSKAEEWNIDAARIACCGGSAGAGISLWVGFHDDMAQPESDEPIARQSTRLTAAGTVDGQCSYDPRWIKEHIGGSGELHEALFAFYGIAREEADSPRAHELYERAAAINYLSPGDPPVYMFYTHRTTKVPLPPDADPNIVIHHPQFGFELKKKMDELGIECVVRVREDFDCPDEEVRDRGFGEMAEFFFRHFGLR